MALNLSRNTQVFFSTNNNYTTGTGFTSANTQELQVMDGYSLTQNTDAQTIQISEAGVAPVRGQRSFNTALQPVDWEITTYIRPRKASNIVKADESVLWNALAGAQAIGIAKPVASAALATTVITYTSTAHGFLVGDYVVVAGYTGASEVQYNGMFYVNATAANTFSVDCLDVRNSFSDLTGGTATPTVTTAVGLATATKASWGEATGFSMAAFSGSNVHQLQSFTLIFKIDNTFYRVQNAAIDNATIDFGIDQIAQVKWAGKGTLVTELTGSELTTSTAYANAATSANFITNKLSTLTFKAGIRGTGTTYSLPITGGNINIQNNLSYLTPALLGIVNTPIGYFTGTRAISGALTAYLRTGSGFAADLLNTLLTNASTATEPKYKIQVELGGSTNATKIEFEMNGAFLQIPTVDVQDVVQTNINFTAEGFSEGANAVYDLERKNELFVKYYSA